MNLSHALAQAPRRGWRTCAALALLVAATTLVGCEEETPRAPTFPTKGSVSFRGQPTPGAMIVLHPKTPIEPPAPNPYGYVDEAGNFVISTYASQDGAPAGEYQATIKWNKLVDRDGEPAPGPNALPVKYAVAATSGVSIAIAAGQNEIPKIEIK